MDFADNLTLWSSLVGSVLPAAVAAINKSTWSAQVKGIVAIIVSILAGGVTAYLNDAFTGQEVVRSVLIVAVLSQVTYQTYWKPSRIAPAIERATEGEGG